ncbi:hypothetical protein [Pyxidicoccus trucidator]|uniref:hypothetical protein n=1 Tax=Pyxidicoccus trucidator TaxID=2709662 RepID=UPI0013D9C869|nr:hypothetical protein [Pyxidicoccus trucidator]
MAVEAPPRLLRSAAYLEKRVALAQQTHALYEREFGDAAAAAWSGTEASQAQAAYCTVSDTVVNDANEASLGLDIKALNAAYCTVSVGPEDAESSTLGITAERAAYSSVALLPLRR